LGVVLEPYFADKYEKATGRTLSKSAQSRHWEHPELAVHVDRLVYANDREAHGVVEIKSFGREAFYKMKRDGMPADYIIQIQHGMLVTNCRWGSFIAGNRDQGGTPLYWDLERDDEICDAILAEGPAFWKTLGDESKIPERLEPDDRRCQRCAWRKTCQGNALLPSTDGIQQRDDLLPLLDEYQRLEAVHKEAEMEYDACREEIKAKLADQQAARVGRAKVYFRPQAGRVTWDAGLAEAYDRLRAKAFVALYRITDSNSALQKIKEDFPPVETFKRQGRDFRTLRIYL
jgi:predicted phage-related endonuclease